MRWKTAKLSSPAKGLLLAIIQARAEGIDQLTAGEWRLEAGIGSGRDWGIALRQLAESGLAELTKRGHMYVITLFALNGSVGDESVSLSSVVRKSVFIDRCTTTAKPTERDEPDQVVVDLEWVFGSNEPKLKSGSNEPNFTGGGGKSGSNEPNYGKYGSNEPKSNMVQMNRISEFSSNEPNPGSNGLKGECIEVDRLDDSGDLARANSAAQLRRRQQVTVVQKVWSEFFPAQPPLVAENGKWFLAHCDQSAEAVYDLLEYVKDRGVDSPLGYARRTAANKEKERTQVPTSPAFVPGPVSSPEPDPVEQERVDRAAHTARVARWRRKHPNEPVPADL